MCIFFVNTYFHDSYIITLARCIFFPNTYKEPTLFKTM